MDTLSAVIGLSRPEDPCKGCLELAYDDGSKGDPCSYCGEVQCYQARLQRYEFFLAFRRLILGNMALQAMLVLVPVLIGLYPQLCLEIATLTGMVLLAALFFVMAVLGMAHQVGKASQKLDNQKERDADYDARSAEIGMNCSHFRANKCPGGDCIECTGKREVS